MALKRCNDRFIKRFQEMEKLSQQVGKDIEDLNMDEMDQLWETAKKKLG